MSATPPKEDTEGTPEVAQDAADTNDARDQQGEQGDGGASAPDSGLYETEVKEQDRWLPIANVARIMKTALPDNAKIAKEAKECMQECVSEFISFITSEAAEKCQHEKRKTVNGEDILFAMTSLGFENYGEALKIYLARYRESQATTTKHGEPPTPTSAITKPAAPQLGTVPTDPPSLFTGQFIIDPSAHPGSATEPSNIMPEPTSATGSIGSTGSAGRAHEALLHNPMHSPQPSQDSVLDTKAMISGSNAFEQHGGGLSGDADPGQGQFLQTGNDELGVEGVVDSVGIE